MSLNLTLTRKGLILVCVPLAFEIIFVGVLYAALAKTESMARRESQSRAVVGEANAIMHTLYQAGYAEVKWRFAWKYEKDKSMLTEFDGFINSIPKRYKRLKELAAGNPRQEQNVERIAGPLNKMVDLLTTFREKVKVDNSIEIDRVAWGKDVAVSSKVLLAQLGAMAEEEERIEDAYAMETARSNDMVKLMLIGGVIFNIILAVSLAIFFSRTVTKRLAILSDNAMLLTMKKPLNKPVEGNDEVAQLDRVFHQMAQTMKDAEQRKQEFVAMLGHDLRTPLAALRGTLALLTRGVYGQLTEKGQQRVEVAEAGADKLMELVSELLEIEKIEAGMMGLKIELVPLAPLFEQIVSSLQNLAEKQQVEIVAEETSIEVMADRVKLERVITNLLSNAIKFSSVGGRVTISASASAKNCEVRVQDHGKGIPKEDLPRIFDRFRQVNRSDETERGGTGLGLAICKAIILSHRGKIGVESKLGKGSTFWFKVPLKGS